MAIFRKRKEQPEQRAQQPSLIPTWTVPAYYTGVNVNDYTALSVSAVWRCTNLIADAIARLPLHAYRGGVRLDSTPTLLDRPNAQETRYDLMFSVVTSLLLRGNAYLLLGDFDALSYPRQVLPIHPDLVSVKRQGGRSIYTLRSPDSNELITLTSDELVHIRGFVFPQSLTGLGVIEAHREGIGAAIAVQEYGARYFNEAAVPTGVIEVPENIDAEDAARLKEEWIVSQGGRSRTPAIMANGMKFTPISVSPQDSQFLETRQFTLQDVANMFNVPGHFVGAPGSSMTYSNVESEWLAFLNTGLAPWLHRIEQAFSDLLPRGTVAKFNADALLRTTTADRYAAHKIGLDAGFLSINEVRSLENLPPVPGGDEVIKNPAPVPPVLEAALPEPKEGEPQDD